MRATINGTSVTQTRIITGQTGGGWGGQNSPNLEFGLGNATIIDELIIEWPSGQMHQQTNITLGNTQQRFMEFTEVPQNNPPTVANPIADQTLSEGSSFTADLNSVFHDPEDDPLVFSRSSNNTGVATANISGNTLTVNAIAAGNAQITVSANDSNGSVSDMFDVTVTGPTTANVSGRVLYVNTSQSPIKNARVQLGSSTTTSDGSGSYQFQNIPLATYPLTASKTDDWGGANATDALKVIRHFVGLETIPTALRRLAADLNNNNLINSTDAFQITQRFIGIRTSFTKPDWLFSELTINLVANSTEDISGIATGDVNASYIPPTTSVAKRSLESKSRVSEKSPTISLSNMTATPSEEVVVRIEVTEFNDIGAISLVINFDESVLGFSRLENVVNNIAFTANQTGSTLNLSWFDATGAASLNAGDTKLLDLIFDYAGGTTSLDFDAQQSEIADAAGDVITGVSFNSGRVSESGQDIVLSLPADTLLTPGEEAAIPIRITEFNDIGAISLVINFDESVLTYSRLENVVENIAFTANQIGGALNVSWFDATGVTPLNAGDGKLMDIIFNYAGGTTALDFNTQQSEIANSAGDVIDNVSFTNGNIGPITSVEDLPNFLPEYFELEQNFPNPFNPSTHIKYHLPRLSQVSLFIYDRLGRKVKTLVAEQQQAGSYNVLWNGLDEKGDSVSSGIYFYKLLITEQQSPFTQTKKMLLIK